MKTKANNLDCHMIQVLHLLAIGSGRKLQGWFSSVRDKEYIHMYAFVWGPTQKDNRFSFIDSCELFAQQSHWDRYSKLMVFSSSPVWNLCPQTLVPIRCEKSHFNGEPPNPVESGALEASSARKLLNGVCAFAFPVFISAVSLEHAWVGHSIW